jgi:hypothetical protein
MKHAFRAMIPKKVCVWERLAISMSAHRAGESINGDSPRIEIGKVAAPCRSHEILQCRIAACGHRDFSMNPQMLDKIARRSQIDPLQPVALYGNGPSQT